MVCFSSVSQIKKIEIDKPEEIGKISALGETYIKCEKVKDYYIFFYKDIQYPNISEYKSFVLKDENDNFNSLYSLLIEGFENFPEKDALLEVTDGVLLLNYAKALGKTKLQIFHTNNKSGQTGAITSLSKKDLIKLFGKK